jgi:hypothetical protein
MKISNNLRNAMSKNPNEMSHQAMLVRVRLVSESAMMAAPNCSTTERINAILMAIGYGMKGEIKNYFSISTLSRKQKLH